VLTHPAPVATISTDPTRSNFATAGGSDGRVRLWTGSPLHQLGADFESDPGHWGNAAYTRDGKHLIVVYDDRTGYVWPVDPAAWASHACAVAGRNFTHEEWRRFVGRARYSATCPG
jgi:WD40 repeat protein